ncbi:MAG: hypothetical protein ABSD38_32030 [Syntrophorhabdales bacterium]|jgi:hypothetical protein
MLIIRSFTYWIFLPLFAEAQVYAGFLPAGAKVVYPFLPRHGGYLYVLEGGPVTVGAAPVPTLAAAMITAEKLGD